MIADTIRKNLFVLVAAYRRATGASLATISNKFYGNATFFTDLKRKRGDPKRISISIDKLDAVLEKMTAAWPHEAERPMLQSIFMDIDPPRGR